MKIIYSWKDPDMGTYDLDTDDPATMVALDHSEQVMGKLLDEQIDMVFDSDTGECTVNGYPVVLPKINYVPKEMPAPVIETKKPKTQVEVMDELRNAADVLLQSNYSLDILHKMKVAYLLRDYEQVMAMAAAEDVPEREELDAKITQVRNPRYEKVNGNVRESNAVAERTDGDDKVAPYLFRIEGVEGLFDSAAEAVVAYKAKDQGEQKSKHLFKSTHIPDAHTRGSCKDKDSAAISIDLEKENDN